MHIPNFTAETSLYRASKPYFSSGSHGEFQRTFVITQLPGKNAPGKAGCIDDCVDAGRTLAYCRNVYCRDHGNPGASSADWFNDFLSSAVGIGVNIACSLPNAPPYCYLLAREIRRQL